MGALPAPGAQARAEAGGFGWGLAAGCCRFPTGRTRLSGGGEGSWASAARVEMTGRAGKQFNCRRLPEVTGPTAGTAPHLETGSLRAY